MPALDPLSASSRPMLSFDTLPKRPLQFAATLLAIDLNSPRTPKPRRSDHVHVKSYPTPPYSHSRGDSTSSDATFRDVEVGSDEWMSAEIATCVDRANGTLDLKNRGLSRVSPRIADLRDLVTLPSYSPSLAISNRLPSSPHPASPSAFANRTPGPGARPFSRISSAPASAGHFAYSSTRNPRYSSGLGVGVTLDESKEEGSGAAASSQSPYPPTPTSRSLGRSKTGAVNLGSSQAQDINIDLSHNQIASLPTALFELQNLTFLSLRGNKLVILPSAIGALLNLRELNISNNHLTTLPSTILNLNLNVFSHYPNDFKKPQADVTVTPSGGLLSPLIVHETSVPRLSTICINLLISPRPPTHLPPLLDSYDWDTSPHPLLNATALHNTIPAIPMRNIPRILQTLRSAAYAYTLPQKGISHRPDPFPRSNCPRPADDAVGNPYYDSCPSPNHFVYDSSATHPDLHLFLNPAEERIEWRKVHDATRLPILWQGCSPGCLSFLERDSEDEWSLDEE